MDAEIISNFSDIDIRFSPRSGAYSDVFPIPVETELTDAIVGEHASRTLVGEHHRALPILEHVGEALSYRSSMVEGALCS